MPGHFSCDGVQIDVDAKDVREKWAAVLTGKITMQQFASFLRKKAKQMGGAHGTVPGSALKTDDRAGGLGSTPNPPSTKRVIDL